MTTFADQAVIAIENVRLFEAEQQRTRELTESLEQQTATSEVLAVISKSPGELKSVFETSCPGQSILHFLSALSTDQLATIAARLPKTPQEAPSGPRTFVETVEAIQDSHDQLAQKSAAQGGFFCAHHKKMQRAIVTTWAPNKT